MAITNYLVHFKTNETFESNKDQLRNDAVAFVGDATIIHTHGTDYYCGSGPVALKSDLANYATTTDLNNYFLKTGGTISGAITVEGAITLIEGGVISCAGQENLLWNDNIVLTEDNWGDYITVSSTDTKNTTGTSNSTSKLYLAGGTSQSDTGVVTYSNANVYTESGQLYATQMNATNGFYETSDARLKNFKDDVKALEVVSAIPTKYFTWKKDEKDIALDPQLHIGTSAQEIQKLYPDLVTENGDGVLSVDYARLSVISLAAIKELKEEINELKAKLQ